MSHCVPSWDLDGHTTLPNSFSLDMLHYEVAELTWENGQPTIGPPRLHTKTPPTAAASSSPTNYAWEKPRAGGTLESIVGQATSFPRGKTAADGGGNELVPWFDDCRRAAPSDTATMSMDALVPCSTTAQEEASTHLHSNTCVMDCSARVESFSAAAANTHDDGAARAPATSAVAAREWRSRDNNSVGGSAKQGRGSRQFTLDSCEREFSVGGFTSTSMGSPGNNVSGEEGTKVTATDYRDSVCHSRPQIEVGGEEDKKKQARKLSTPTKKKRAAATHNQSERKRRDKISQRMKTLQKMIPNSSKTDKASILDEVIEYLKQLKAQVQMMSTMCMPYMMMPMAMQQQQLHQLSMMGMGMGMGVMDMNTIGRPNMAGIPPVLHSSAAFKPLRFWDGSGGDHLPASALSTFLACQSQPMTMEAYSRMMAALYQQQLNQPPPSDSKNP